VFSSCLYVCKIKFLYTLNKRKAVKIEKISKILDVYIAVNNYATEILKNESKVAYILWNFYRLSAYY